jgi:Icc-related predicted phosphoesterase
MRIVALADLHGETAPSPRVSTELAAADVVLLAGDVTHFGNARAAADVIGAVRRHNGRVLAVPGNCDGPEVGAYLAGEGISLDVRHVMVDGIAFAGVGGSLPCPGRTPNEITEAEFAEYLVQAVAGVEAETPLVLLVHQPPFGTAADLAGDGRHVGSEEMRVFIVERQPLVCFAGHIHEARGKDRIGDTIVLNPGRLSAGGYAYAEIDAQNGSLLDAGVSVVR